MLKSSYEYTLDELDISILRELQHDGRISNVELSRRVNLSPPATHARHKRLEDGGYIRHYVALLDQEKAGYDMMCFINVNLQLHRLSELANFRAVINEMPEVLECFHITGDFDFLLKVVVRSRRDLQRFVVERLTPVPGIAKVQTSLVLSQEKSTTELPL